MTFPFNFFIIILSIFSIIKKSFCNIVFPFEITNENLEISKEKYELMSYLNSLSLYTNILIGNPPQHIKSFIRFDKSGFNIPENAYIHNQSNTYKRLSENKKIFDEIEYNGILSSDDIILINIDSKYFSTIIQNKNKIYDKKYQKVFENITFINIITDEIGYKDYGYLGLKFPDKNKFDIINFVPLLKDKNIINNCAWTLIFEQNNENNIYTIDSFNKIKGYLILGDELYNYYPMKYLSNISYNITMGFRNGSLNWETEFTNIYIKDFKIYISSNVEFRPDLSLNFGSLGFKINIDSIFFSPLFKESICLVNNMTLYPNIMYYMCDTSKKGANNTIFDLEKFPDLIFEHKRLEGNFTLNYKELFIQDNRNKNIYYFIFVFDRNKIYNLKEDRFIFGMKFFEKYQFEFDNDKKLIRYYNILSKCKNINERNYQKNNKNYKIIIIIGLIVIFGILLFILGMLFQKSIVKIPRKLRANELDDEDYEYKVKNDEKIEEVKLGINE